MLKIQEEMEEFEEDEFSAEKEVDCMGRLICLQSRNCDELFLRTGIEEEELAFQINK
jgi:hypothetical protein